MKNMQHLEEVYNVTLVSQDYERIRAHKVVLAYVSIPSGTCSRLMTRKHILNLSIYKRSIGVQWGIYGERKRLWTFPEDQYFYRSFNCFIKGDNPVGTENVTNNKEWFENTRPVKAAVFEEWKACFFFCIKNICKIVDKIINCSARLPP